MHNIYMPFTEDQLLSHFLGGKEASPSEKAKYVGYYLDSIKRYDEFCNNNPDRRGKSFLDMRLPCQIEKDERFWVASCMMTVFYSPHRTEELVNLFRCAYGDFPPMEGVGDWGECLQGKLHLFFEPSLPSPRSYKRWLVANLARRQFIPYVLDSAYQKQNLEGATNTDALLLNSESGFAVIIEAKILSDASCQIVYDAMRNQISRSIDVMLEENGTLHAPLDRRDPSKTLFLLITPKIFRDNPTSRLYGYKLNEYKNDSDSLSRDLPHRPNCDWKAISRRLGWLCWEDFKKVNDNCCRWVK